MPLYAYIIVAAGSLLWAAAFPLFHSGQASLTTLDKRARWGLLLQCLGYTLLWQGPFWTRQPAWWQVSGSIVFLVAASLLSWTAARALGRQLRVDAALHAEHELIRSGPYRVVRHPIYTSMLSLLVGTGLLMTSLYLFIPALAVFLIGTEIRMRMEERLLAARFGESFESYRRTRPRIIPGIGLF